MSLRPYKCTKEVKAKPMDRFTAQGLGLVRDETDVNEAGYYVEYNKDYASWQPKQPFENGYQALAFV